MCRRVGVQRIPPAVPPDAQDNKQAAEQACKWRSTPPQTCCGSACSLRREGGLKQRRRHTCAEKRLGLWSASDIAPTVQAGPDQRYPIDHPASCLLVGLLARPSRRPRLTAPRATSWGQSHNAGERGREVEAAGSHSRSTGYSTLFGFWPWTAS